MKSVIIVHHHEITLKGSNRKYFEKVLHTNILRSLQGILPPKFIKGGYGRSVINLPEGISSDSVLNKLVLIFGIANICTGVEVNQEINSFCEASRYLLEGSAFETIKVTATRADKRFPTRSMEVNAQVGEYICRYFNVRANMKQPDKTIFIEIADGTAYVYCSKTQGSGGLPVGVSGKVVSLLSAGFDSPVASWRIMKRGATTVFVHFHSMPYTSQHSVDQVRQLVHVLTKYQFQSKLYLVPFADLQSEIVLKTPQHLRIILYRRFMMRVAEEIARIEKAEALVTGEAVGQVASQTLRNIRNIENAVTLPILRPLSGMDKEETIMLARQIGTHDISKEPYDDCCSFLAPRKPETWSNIAEIKESELKLDIPSMLDSISTKISIEYFSFPQNIQEDSTKEHSSQSKQ